MTVSELIEELRKYPPDMPIVTHHEGDTFWDGEPEYRLMDRDKDGQYYFCDLLCDEEGIPLKEGHQRIKVALFW